MKQTSKMFSISCENDNSEKGDIRTDIEYFQQTMLMAMVDMTNIRK